ncbi:glycosyltransferase family 32 protein [Romboutsia lituseburensis]|uniref:Glycosyltransferase sugar-binding region containing DXD motif-containing protein n=1 Tax=Romboutsia lituseburensis DSM 797 TaxID=1121325 RepID=A0A1G9KCC9_9FIRM|nr:glycosyltransferase [Romboutsia lituseburensis]CEH34846.1 Mannosyltransferase OCH1-like enzyme [Romboutsia lituseburensis]SDL47094.1 Glycosyltransferase sugar-binding region containing DXD motif-containing protein [Romboutsia lituseburensis DSM 797]
MIPKKIHYCWFGNKDKPTLVLDCINSWNQYLSDYTIIEWNESNFDINSNIYVRQAYESKKYAFVSDYVRLYALYKEGGIYFDTDVEVVKNMDKFLNLDGFTGFESTNWAVTATMGSVPQSKIIKLLLDYYTNKQFIVNNRYDLTTNTKIITNIFKKYYDISLDGEKQNLLGTNFIIYPVEYFCPIDYSSKKATITENTHTIHHFNKSWH